MASRGEDQARLFAFQALLDGSSSALEQTVNLDKLREICAQGVPDHPPHLRPLAYSLLLECLPTEKRAWKATERQQRERYHALVETFTKDLNSQGKTGETSSTPSKIDQLLLAIAQDVQRIATRSSFWRGRTITTRSSPLHPPSREYESTGTTLEDFSSSSDEDVGNGAAPRTRAEPILSRRALFSRLDHLAEAEHRRSSVQMQSSASSSSNSRIQSRNSGETASTDPSSPGTTMLSPKITLSVEPTLPSPMLSRLDAKRPTPISTTELSIDNLASPNPTGHKPPSPITLLSPQPIPKSGSTTPLSSSSLSGSLYHPDAHSEALTRLLYVFCRTNAHRPWQPAFADIAGILYVVYAGATAALDSRNGKRANASAANLGDAEERTLWALTAIISEMDGLWDDSASGIGRATQKLERRLYWADPDLYTALRDNQLDPAGPLYTHRWLINLFTSDLALTSIPSLWDYILSGLSATADEQPKVDAAVDVAVSMLLVTKSRLLHPRQRSFDPSPRKISGLWADAEDDISPADMIEPDEIMIHGLKLLRAYPLSSIGGIGALVYTAGEIQQARTSAANDPDEVPVPPTGTGSGFLGKIGTMVGNSEWTETSTAWASSAANTLAGMTIANQPDESSNSTWESLGKSAGKLWQSAWTTKPVSGTVPEPNSNMPTTPPRAIGRFPASLSRRDRSDSAASSVSSIHERITSWTAFASGSGSQQTPPNGGHTKSASLQSPGPRPLLLSGSARRASASASGATRSGSMIPLRSATREVAGSPTSNATLSPPPTANRSPSPLCDTPTQSGSGGLYRIGSRQSQLVKSTSISSELSESSIGRNLDYGE